MSIYNTNNTMNSEIYRPRVLEKNNKRISSREDRDEDIEPVKQIVVKKVFDESIRCIKCSENHKFSPFNVQVNPNRDVIKVIGMIDFNNKFIVRSIENVNEYVRLDRNMIEKNELPENYILSWSDGINIFSSDNGLITLFRELVNNINLHLSLYLSMVLRSEN